MRRRITLLPAHKKSLFRPRRLHLNYEFGSDTKNQSSAQYERNKRNIPSVAEVKQAIYYPNQNKPVSSPLTPTEIKAIDRWHKYSDFRITVSKKHKATLDPVAESDAFDTITGAITFAKSYFSALSLIYTNPRITIEVHGGMYDEYIVLDVSYLDFEGIGMPLLLNSVQQLDNETHAVFTITEDCTQTYIKGFRIRNYGDFEGISWWCNLGLNIEPGNETGLQYSSIVLQDVYLEGTSTQAYIQRRILGINYHSKSINNLVGGLGGNTEGSTLLRYCKEDGDISKQRGWSEFFNSTFEGENSSTSIIDKGKAIAVYAVDSDLTTWISNAVTMASGDTTHENSRTGVILHFCNVIGWSHNKGWVFQYDFCALTQGKWINDDGAGACHHIMEVNSDAGVGAWTWMKGNTHASVNYLVDVEDTKIGVTGTAAANVYLFYVEHNTPTGVGVGNVAGSAIVGNQFPGFGGGTAASLIHAFGDHSSTHANFFYFSGGGEAALLADSTASPAGGPARANYQSIKKDYYSVLT